GKRHQHHQTCQIPALHVTPPGCCQSSIAITQLHAHQVADVIIEGNVGIIPDVIIVEVAFEALVNLVGHGQPGDHVLVVTLAVIGERASPQKAEVIGLQHQVQESGHFQAGGDGIKGRHQEAITGVIPVGAPGEVMYIAEPRLEVTLLILEEIIESQIAPEIAAAAVVFREGDGKPVILPVQDTAHLQPHIGGEEMEISGGQVKGSEVLSILHVGIVVSERQPQAAVLELVSGSEARSVAQQVVLGKAAVEILKNGITGQEAEGALGKQVVFEV